MCSQKLSRGQQYCHFRAWDNSSRKPVEELRKDGVRLNSTTKLQVVPSYVRTTDLLFLQSTGNK